MLTMHWIKCLSDRGLPLVMDSLSNINGRIVTWQMESLSYLLPKCREISIPNDDWRVHFASDHIINEPFIGKRYFYFQKFFKTSNLNYSKNENTYSNCFSKIIYPFSA